MADVHTHPGGAPHAHDQAAPGHTHEQAGEAPPPGAMAPTAAAVELGPTGGGIAARMALTILGAAGMIVGALLPWAFEDPGTSVEFSVFYDVGSVNAEAGIVTSAGTIFIVLGLLALLGLAFRTGWLTRLAGALGLVGWVLILLQLNRIDSIGNIQIGLWVTLLGSIVALVGGFLGSRPRVVATSVPS